VFVTGDSGFKGAWLASWLVQLGAEVTGYALDPPTDPSLFDGLDLGGQVRQVVADVRDRDRLAAEVAAARPAVIFHLAAQSLVRLGYAKPHETFETNVIGTVNVLEAARGRDSVEAVVIVTSDKCYRNLEVGHPFREDDAMGGRDPYSASKGCAELVAGAYRDSFFKTPGSAAVASARAGNVIGGGDWAPERIIPDCVRALAADEPVLVRNPNAVRPWQHVLEPLSGYLQLASVMLRDGHLYEGPWNFGPASQDGARPVRWVVEHFLEAWGSGSWTSPEATGEPLHEARFLGLDSTKARNRLGWAPVWDAQSAVGQTAAWYREYSRGLTAAAARDLMSRQIRAYESDARAAGLAWAAAEDAAQSR
jgi:CDP-glucose 4,6-dehydratase